jgi:hypothetical protein
MMVITMRIGGCERLMATVVLRCAAGAATALEMIEAGLVLFLVEIEACHGRRRVWDPEARRRMPRLSRQLLKQTAAERGRFLPVYGRDGALGPASGGCH